VKVKRIRTRNRKRIENGKIFKNLLANLQKVFYNILTGSFGCLTIILAGGNIMLRFTAAQADFLCPRLRCNSQLWRGQIKIICAGA